jgi:hypothetical protein
MVWHPPLVFGDGAKGKGLRPRQLKNALDCRNFQHSRLYDPERDGELSSTSKGVAAPELDGDEEEEEEDGEEAIKVIKEAETDAGRGERAVFQGMEMSLAAAKLMEAKMEVSDRVVLASQFPLLMRLEVSSVFERKLECQPVRCNGHREECH